MQRLAKPLLWAALYILAALPTSLPAQQVSSTSSPFVVPAGLEPAVEFWKRVFSEFGRSQLIFFDPLDMSKIYEVIEVGEDNRTDGYIDGERARIAAANGVDIERVRAQRGIKERTAAGIKRSGRYLAQIQRIFSERGLPVELSYLPIVESSYDIGARSSVGALGIWQFMPRTGREYMRVNSLVDERRDPIESSRAAAAYLKQAYDSLGSWPLAITSYNYGQGGMARAVAQLESDNLVELIEKYEHPYWGFAPKQFYAEFLAAVEIGSNVSQYFPGLVLDQAVEIKEIEVAGKPSLSSLISSSGLSRAEFLAWNPALSPVTRTVPAGYRVKLPIDRAAPTPTIVTFAQVQSPAKPAKAQVVHHRVRRGETIYEIARRYGATVENILQINGLRKAHVLKAGSTLRIPKL
ncbi:MAG TPA: transglycosylase SLT domain-containing protein [Candidatus Binatia bacterium]